MDGDGGVETPVSAANAPPETTRVKILKALIWPALILALAFVFREPLSHQLEPPSNGTSEFKVGSWVTYQRAGTSAAAAGIATGIQLAQSGSSLDQNALDAAATRIGDAVSPQHTTDVGAKQAAAFGSVLWVDDIPTNNLSLSNAFQSLGIKVIQVTSTQAALEKLKDTGFDVIITDMTRQNDNEAGLKLIQEVRKTKKDIPIIIYAANWAREHSNDAQKLSVTAITNDPAVVYSDTIRFAARHT